MTTYNLHLISPHEVMSLLQRIEKIISTGDMSDWAKLHKSLEPVYATPHLFQGSVSSIDQPLTRCSFHSNNKPDLVADQLPDRRSINWLVMQLLEMTASARCKGGWSKFGSDYDILLQEHVLPNHRDLREVHQRFVDLIFAPPQSEIPELEFLRNPDAYCSVTTTETLAKFMEEPDVARYFDTCVNTFMSLPDNIWRILAADIRRLELFLRLTALSRQRAVWFKCWAT